MQESSKKEECRRILRRIAWRIQYEAKKQMYRSYGEKELFEETCKIDQMESVDSRLMVEDLLSSLPDQPRFIIQRIVIEGATEKEVAEQLHVTQQRVNSCKRKYLKQLRQTLTSA